MEKEMLEKAQSIMSKIEDVSVTQEEIDDLVKKGTVTVTTMPNEVTTYVELELESGFKIIETSTCSSKDIYDENLGLEICMGKIKDRLWAFYSFHKFQTRQEARQALKFLKPYEADKNEENK